MNRLYNWKSISMPIVALLLSACTNVSEKANNWVKLKPESAASGSVLHITGTVHRLDLEGGLFVIRSTEGTQYNPINLPETFRVDAMAIEADAYLRESMASISMVGPIVELIRIRGRSEIKPTISGSVSYRERMALPPDAILQVRLADVSKQDVSATTIAETSISTAGQQVPIPFILTYDPAMIVEKHQYIVRATIMSQGDLLFTTDTQYPVITQGNLSRVNLLLVRAAQPTKPVKGLMGSTWILEDIAGAGVVDSVRATLEFSDENTVSGDGSCNRFHGGVTVSNGAISFSALAATRKMCAEAVMHQEQQYLTALHSAQRFELKEPFLFIYAAGQLQPVRFIRPD